MCVNNVPSPCYLVCRRFLDWDAVGCPIFLVKDLVITFEDSIPLHKTDEIALPDCTCITVGIPVRVFQNMASRVELKLTPLPELVDSPDIDPNTQRPRTPNTVPTDFPLIQRKNIRKVANTFFTRTEPGKYAGDFRRHRRTYMIPKEVLYMQNRRDVFWVGPEWSRKSEYQHDGAPPSAVLPWPREQAGERVEKHLKNESRENFLGIEHYRRPPTNLPVKSIMKYGRATGGYYAERFPSKIIFEALHFDFCQYLV
ncbi:hypothetical protein SprV_0401554900 [Sparganum proliferum]